MASPRAGLKRAHSGTSHALNYKYRYDLGDSTRDRHPAFVKLADRSAFGRKPFTKTEEKRMKGDVKRKEVTLGLYAWSPETP